jgi:hypothetical protein
MTRVQWTVLIATTIGFIGGTLIYWFVPWSGTEIRDNATSYVAFLIALVGFGILIYQLKETEQSIQENLRMPALELQVLSLKSSHGLYSSAETNQLVLCPDGSDVSKFWSSCAFRITNTGNKTASRIYFTFVFTHKGARSDDIVNGLSVAYNSKNRFNPVVFKGSFAKVTP